MTSVAPKILLFSSFKVDLTRGTLSCGGEPRTLRRQSFDVLCVLAARSGQVVAAEDIVAAVWKSPPANPDASLSQCIKDIRRALGDDGQWMIRTVPGSGYEFKPEVAIRQTESAARDIAQKLPPEPEPPPAMPSTSAVPASQLAMAPGDPSDRRPAPGHPQLQTRLLVPPAVAPPLAGSLNPRGHWAMAAVALGLLALIWMRSGHDFGSISPPPVMTMLATPSVAFLPATLAGRASDTALTMPDEIATELRRTPRGFDIAIKAFDAAHSTNVSPEAAARKLDVRYLVKTSIRQESKSRQVIVQLIEGATGRQIWATTAEHGIDDRDAQNLAAAQIARRLAIQLRTAENARPLPLRPEAGHYALQGRILLESERDGKVNNDAMALFDKALSLNPKHVQSLLGYARTRIVAVNNNWMDANQQPRALDEARVAIDSAITQDRTMTGAHLLRGALARAKGEFELAVASFEHARSLNPNYPFVHAELGRAKLDLGKPQEALAHLQEALLLSPTDPVSSFWYFWAGMASAQLGDFENSLDWLLKSRQANPRYPNAGPWLAIAYAKQGFPDKARETIREHIRNNPKFNVAAWLNQASRNNQGLKVRLAPFADTLREIGAPDRI